MIARPGRTTAAAILLSVLGAFALINATIGILAAEWYNAILFESMRSALGTQTSELLESSSRFTIRVTQLSWIIGIVEAVLHWVAAAAVLARGGSWGRIVGLVIGAIGLFGATFDTVAYVSLGQWAAPLPALAWLERDSAVLGSIVASVLLVAGYVVTLLLLARTPERLGEGTAAVR